MTDSQTTYSITQEPPSFLVFKSLFGRVKIENHNACKDILPTFSGIF